MKRPGLKRQCTTHNESRAASSLFSRRNVSSILIAMSWINSAGRRSRLDLENAQAYALRQ